VIMIKMCCSIAGVYSSQVLHTVALWWASRQLHPSQDACTGW